MHKSINFSVGNVQFFGTYTLELYLVILIIVLVSATWVDIREHRIPNWLVATGLFFAIVYHSLSPFGQGVGFTIAGLAVGTTALMPLYVMKTMGAGDVKLMGMVGAYVGTAAVIGVLLATLIVGGVLAIVASAYKHALPQLLENLRTMVIQRDIRRMGGTGSEDMSAPPSVGKLPYAVAIAAGTALQIFVLRP